MILRWRCLLLMTDDDVLHCGQYELDGHDLHALERLRLRLRLRLRGGDATAMRATIARAGGVVVAAARAHVMAIPRLDRLDGVWLDIHTRARAQ